MFRAECSCVLLQGEPGYGMKGEKGDGGAPGAPVSDTDFLTLILKMNVPEHHGDGDAL